MKTITQEQQQIGKKVMDLTTDKFSSIFIISSSKKIGETKAKNIYETISSLGMKGDSRSLIFAVNESLSKDENFKEIIFR